MEKVTIVIPVYNVASYIERSLNSALSQTFPNIEYILIDDKGKDNSIEVARSVFERHRRKNDVRIIDHGKNRGVGAVKNTGINNATGKYLYFFDSDDELTPDAIEILYREIESTGVDYAMGSYKSIDYGNTGKKWEWLFEKRIIKGSDAIAEFYLKGGFYVMTWNKLMRTKFLRTNNIYCIEENNHKYDDVYFTFQLALKAQSIAMVPDVTYFYSFRGGSLMYEMDEKAVSDFCIVVSYLKKYSWQYEDTYIYPRIIYYIYGLAYGYLNQLNGNKSVSPAFKKEYLRKFSIKFLSLKKIWLLKRTKPMHKIKYCVSFFPYWVQLILLRLIKYFVGNSLQKS